MEILSRIADVRAAVARRRALGQTIGLVPTMGALHEGHLALVAAARARAACAAMSIFVNPLQFGPKDDFAAYPRASESDSAKAREHGVDLLFAPAAVEMYPEGQVTTTVTSSLATRWEAAARPGHFAGVLTVVAKLLHIVQPDVAVFGQKDAQQVVLVRAMARELDFPTEIVVAPTVRDADGVAMSSRNAYLSAGGREQATVLFRALSAMHEAWRDAGLTDSFALESIGRRVLATEQSVSVEYLGIAEPARLEPCRSVEPGCIAMVAVRVGRTRLIDNVVFAR